jgi:hypothetical protein
VAAASAILDRGWGRPMQQVHVEAQASALPAELAALSPEDKRKAADLIMRGLAAENAKVVEHAPSETVTDSMLPADEVNQRLRCKMARPFCDGSGSGKSIGRPATHGKHVECLLARSMIHQLPLPAGFKAFGG